MNKIQKIFVSGLISFLPIAVTIYIVSKGISVFENLLGSYMRDLLPENAYIPGYGFIATIILIFLLGLLLNNIVTGAILHKVQQKLTEIPLIKVIYSPLRDLMKLFSKSDGSSSSMQKVVLVKIDDHKEIIGLVTRESFEDLDSNLKISSNKVAVFIPLSYSFGGFTILVDKSQTTPLEISVDKAMSLAVTGWIKTDSSSTSNK